MGLEWTTYAQLVPNLGLTMPYIKWRTVIAIDSVDHHRPSQDHHVTKLPRSNSPPLLNQAEPCQPCHVLRLSQALESPPCHSLPPSIPWPGRWVQFLADMPSIFCRWLHTVTYGLAIYIILYILYIILYYIILCYIILYYIYYILYILYILYIVYI